MSRFESRLSEMSMSICAADEDQGIIFESVHDIPLVSDQIDSIAREILQIVIIQKNKTIKDINKIFQATLSNYFFECYVCGLILDHSKEEKMNKKQLKQRIESRLNYQSDTNCDKDSKKLPKYIQMIQIYGDEIEAKGLQKEYVDLLSKIIEGNDEIKEQSILKDKYFKRHATMTQKKLSALLVLEFFLHRHFSGPNYTNFSELWNSVFPNFQINYFARERNIVQGKVTAIQDFVPLSLKIEEKRASTKEIPQIAPNTTLPYSQLLLRESENSSSFLIFSNNQKRNNLLIEHTSSDSKSDSPLHVSSLPQSFFSAPVKMQNSSSHPIELNLKRKCLSVIASPTYLQHLQVKKRQTASFAPLSMSEFPSTNLEIIQSIGSFGLSNNNPQTIINLSRQQKFKM